MAEEKFMRFSIDKAKEGIANGQEPFGACVIRDGNIIGVAHNTALRDHDVTAHAEINAIRMACKVLNTLDLSGCEIYATFKPCRMCQEACERAKISKIYYGAGPEDIGSSPVEVGIQIEAGFLRDECLEMLQKARQ
ncbi:tRNA-specific adenosine deaminase [Candidatus Bathyarchaeota archaeon]|jgi:tRNA(Arg) A34 adenosine deaminase TadA|nr:tRNA-specific adenosine deaminase [Candidatus Bathyarchaeota archaeon]MDP6048789.1 nucleoside deaminase [Candidatus Bathyarchaeota archaeon]MDP7207760.1 nucleoside deaminase [Candidatus Bathyarchaeota archaeon]MDP7443920.1 nucleoside deaminase [Candidatus Bathyarchaeota archaeon]|tara:strand:+ start:6753 stop:7160 length:408 start_codon:yes stop_codon:yes gene_type:complete